MVSLISESMERTWEKWNVRAVVILSLFIQTFLVLFSPLRMRTASLSLTAFLWCAYLLADWAASFAVGQISSSQLSSSSNNQSPSSNDELLAFWTPFLLLHLGGPDTITAFSLEDNALWRRYFLSLLFQVLAAAYIFLLSLPSDRLWVPTALVFVSGIIKCVERMRALYLASSDIIFKDDALKQDGCVHPYTGNPPLRPVSEGASTENLEDIPLVVSARTLFGILRGSRKSEEFTGKEPKESQFYLLARNSEAAMRIISLELNFLYQTLYTKAFVVHSKLGYIFRLTSFIAVVTALLLFGLLDRKSSDLDSTDVRITYALLYGAIFIDVIYLFMLGISDWNIHDDMDIGGLRGKIGSHIAIIFRNYLKLRRPNWATKTREPHSSSFTGWAQRILFRRWSESVSCFNLIQHCLEENSELRPRDGIIDRLAKIYIRAIDVLGLKDFRDRVNDVSSKPLSKELWDFLFKEVYKYTAGIPEGEHIVPTARGDSGHRVSHIASMKALEFDESLIWWHIATEICYNTDDIVVDQERREISKVLSDYMIYLLVMQPAMMSSLEGIGQKRFQDACKMAQALLGNKKVGGIEEACRSLHGKMEHYYRTWNWTFSDRDALSHGCLIAWELKEELKGKKWKVISEAWVELLAYAACNIGTKSHAQLLPAGGELISFVWLLMANFGVLRNIYSFNQEMSDDAFFAYNNQTLSERDCTKMLYDQTILPPDV